MGSLYGVAYFTLAVSYARKMLMKLAKEKFYKVCPKLINGTNGCLDEMLSVPSDSQCSLHERKPKNI